MKPERSWLCVFLLLAFANRPLAAAEFTPETFTVEAKIQPGPNVLINYASWDGSSKLHVYGRNGLAYKGLLGMGLTSQFVLAKDGKTAFTLSDYMKRYTYGPIESVVQVFDIETLTEKKEIIVPNKAVKAISMTQLIELSADDKLVYVQNATPATSVTVVDVLAGKVLREIPNPGCYGIIPAAKGRKFSTLCGTGEIKTYTLTGDGYTVETSTMIFNPDEDPIYLHAQRRGTKELIFTSFKGNLYFVDDTGKSAVLKKTLSVTAKIDGGWAPGGFAISAYNKANDMLFLLMHSGAYEGSHKDASEEIWAYSLGKSELVSRIAAPHLVALAVSQEKSPHLYGANEEEETIDEYTPVDGKRFTYELSASDGKAGWSTALMVAP